MARRRSNRNKPTKLTTEPTLRTNTSQSETRGVWDSEGELDKKWAYIAANQRRWTSREGDVKELRFRCSELLSRLGFDSSALADARYAEISLPYDATNPQWDLLRFPWEFVLAQASSHRPKPLTVVRHLRLPETRSPESAPSTLGFIQNDPRPLDEFYSFYREYNVVRHALQFRDENLAKKLKRPTRDELESWLKKEKPDIIHFTGLDVSEAVELVGLDEDLDANEILGGGVARKPPKVCSSRATRSSSWMPSNSPES